MASVLVTIGVWFLLHRRTKATTEVYLHRSNGMCKQMIVPVSATADSAIYDLPQVNTDIEAAAWAIWDSTRTHTRGAADVIKNTTTSGTFNINVQFCSPVASEDKGILQIATHGAHYDSRYWDSAYQPENHSYVNAALQAGYAILTYDRLGAGQSDIPDAYNVVQAPLELEILRQLTLMARNGSLYDDIASAGASDSMFSNLTKPRKVVHVGHSFGSLITTALIARYGELSDGAIITGWLVNEWFTIASQTTWAAQAPGSSCPPFDRSSGYVVCTKVGIQSTFFGGDPATAFSPALLDYGNEIKQPVPIGELASASPLIDNYGPSFHAPALWFLAENDFDGCRGDCKGLANLTALAQTYPNATAIEVAIQPNTGHALPLHHNATAGFGVMFDFLKRHGL